MISIIAILTGVALPSMKNIGKSNTLAAANTQLVDDLNQARQTAIARRTVVHVFFVPNFFQQGIASYNTKNDANDKLANRLLSGAFTTYTIFAERSVGDQPGQSHPRYLRGGEWKSLPDGVFIWPAKFTAVTAPVWDSYVIPGSSGNTNRPFKQSLFPYPTATGKDIKLPHISFSPSGSLITYDSNFNPVNPQDEYIPLSRGSILAVRDDNGVMIDLDVREAPIGTAVDNPNIIHIDAFSGRSRLERPEIQ